MEKKKKRFEEMDYEPDGETGSALGGVINWLGHGISGTLRWLWRGVAGFGRWLWRLTGMAFRGMWWLTVWAAKFTWRGTVATLHWAKNVALWPFRLLGRLIFGPPEARLPEFDAYGNPNYAAIRRRVGRRYRRRGWFIVHLATFALANIAAWLNYYYWLEMADPQYRVYYHTPSSMTLAWLIFLAAHIIYVWVRENEDKAVDHEIDRQRQSARFDETRYQQREMRLSSDGELVEIVRDEDYEEKRKTQDYAR